MSNGCNSRKETELSLLVDEPALDNFSTLLQSGVYLSCMQGESIADLLGSLDGFTRDYIENRVQTIFLNGLPADDLDQQIFGTEATLAVSAAMPGLAGAIFRKGGKHSSLRTGSAVQAPAVTGDDLVLVRIKLFNMIARERGKEVLAETCRTRASSLERFLSYRPSLAAAIRKVEIDGQILDVHSVIPVKAGIQGVLKLLDSRFHGNDEKGCGNDGKGRKDDVFIQLTIRGDHES